MMASTRLSTPGGATAPPARQTSAGAGADEISRPPFRQRPGTNLRGLRDPSFLMLHGCDHAAVVQDHQLDDVRHRHRVDTAGGRVARFRRSPCHRIARHRSRCIEGMSRGLGRRRRRRTRSPPAGMHSSPLNTSEFEPRRRRFFEVLRGNSGICSRHLRSTISAKVCGEPGCARRAVATHAGRGRGRRARQERAVSARDRRH